MALVTRVAWLVPALALACCATAGAQEFSLDIRDGRVTLIANDAPLRDVLSEWARVGQTTIVDGDKLPGQIVTLHLIDVPEARALQTLLRSASGFLAAPRPANSPGASRYDRILILATSRAPRNAPQPVAAPLFPDAVDPMADPAAVSGDMYGLSPDQAQQFQQLQELLQQPPPADAADAEQNVPTFSDRPGMPSVVPDPEPPDAGRPQRPPFAPGNPFVPQGTGVAVPNPRVPAPPPVYPQPFFPSPAPER